MMSTRIYYHLEEWVSDRWRRDPATLPEQDEDLAILWLEKGKSRRVIKETIVSHEEPWVPLEKDRYREACTQIEALSAGWDDQGSTGPRGPLSWESVGRAALDYARFARTQVKPNTKAEQ